ncbi:hypothetical protein ACBI99_29490 [Nonomuraea sp. ATR24]|uniref:hypothetical protein n=1 Tax=Nonomuraea sp. ATR24 TaxID=1676744 RepID=UPI0035C22337
MWQRGMNWAAIAFVGTFSVMWLGVVVYADVASAFWTRAGQVVFALFLLGWAGWKAAIMIGKA